MGCPPICPRESVPQHQASPGIIAGDETICRAVYETDRGDKGVLKASAIRKPHLWDGTLSVWRISQLVGVTTAAQLAGILPEYVSPRRNNEEFDQLRGVFAREIRAVHVTDERVRACSILDDCRVNNEGGTHPAHASIAVCQTLKAGMADANDALFLLIQELLKNLFDRPPIWQRPN